MEDINRIPRLHALVACSTAIGRSDHLTPAPSPRPPPPAQDSLTIKPPAAVAVIGSAAYGALARPDPTVDIAVELPTDFLAPKAHLNYRYHARRAAYLVAVAAYLRDASYSLYGEQRIECLHGDPARPALVIRPATAEGYSLRLLPAIAPDTFALPRLAPDRNGVRAHTKEAKGQLAAGGAATEEASSAGSGQQQQQLLPTPHYNAGIVEDMMFSIHAARLKVRARCVVCVPSGPRSLHFSVFSLLSTSVVLCVLSRSSKQSGFLNITPSGVLSLPQAALSSAPQLTDGLHLLKVWARQHGLAPCSSSSSSSSIGMRASWGCGGCLDGAVLASLVALLAERNKMVSSCCPPKAHAPARSDVVLVSCSSCHEDDKVFGLNCGPAPSLLWPLPAGWLHVCAAGVPRGAAAAGGRSRVGQGPGHGPRRARGAAGPAATAHAARHGAQGRGYRIAICHGMSVQHYCGMY